MEKPHAQSGPHAWEGRTTLPDHEAASKKILGRDRRAYDRRCVDGRAVIFLIDVRAQIPGHIIDISLGGCRIRTEQRFPVGIYRRVETEFKLDGMPFRLGGVIQAVHDRFTVGIRFLDMSSRKRDQLAELIAETNEAGNRE